MAKSRQGKSNFQRKQDADKEVAEKVINESEGVDVTPDVLDEEDTFETLKNLWNRYGINLSLVILLMLAGYFGYQWYSNNAEQKRFERVSDLDNPTKPSELMDVATNYSSHEPTHQQALYFAGLAYLDEGLIKSSNDPAASKESVTRAQQTFELLLPELASNLEKTNLPNNLFINTHFNLARAYENLGEFDKARQSYDAAIKVIKDWNTSKQLNDDEGSFAHKLAKLEEASKAIDELKTPINFPAAPPTTQPAIETTELPETQPATIETSTTQEADAAPAGTTTETTTETTP